MFLSAVVMLCLVSSALSCTDPPTTVTTSTAPPTTTKPTTKITTAPTTTTAATTTAAATQDFCTASTPYSTTNPATFPLTNATFTEPSQPTTAVLDPSVAAVSTYITKKHNCLRSRVSPTASNMLKMQWNAEAAAQAQTWANNCVYAHNSQSQRTTSQFACGQNIASSTGTTLSWNQVVNMWYNEVNSYVYGGTNSGSAVTGHYTQIVWATTFQVGCGYKSCPASGSNAAFNFYVCNYCPAGNIVGSTGTVGTPYTSGASCGSCASACESGKLCTNNCAYTDVYSNCQQLNNDYQICTPGTSNYDNLHGSCQATCLCQGSIH